MSGDVHVRFRERLGVRFPRATRLVLELMSRPPVILFLGASVSQDVKCFSLDRTLAELKDALGTPASVATIWRAVAALDVTVKKNGPALRTRST